MVVVGTGGYATGHKQQQQAPPPPVRATATAGGAGTSHAPTNEHQKPQLSPEQVRVLFPSCSDINIRYLNELG